MRKIIVGFIFVFVLTFDILAQTYEARQIDAFGRIPCGDFMARMDAIFNELQNSPNSKIYVVYYGGRNRRENIWNKKTKSFDKIKLKYPHREDGLNWAKSIPLYLTTYPSYPSTIRDLLKDKIVLVNGGFRENTEVEIWLVPKDVESPKPTPSIAEKNIKFTNGKPYKTPIFTDCYSGY